MAKAHTHGSGWHKESLRHRNARLKGRAGGQYSGRVYVEHKGKNADGSQNHYYTLVPREQKIDFLMKSHLHTRAQLENMDEGTLNDFFKAGLNATGYTPYKDIPAPYTKKDMTYNQLKKVGVKLKPTGDADGDGVPNSLDCRPLNKHKQDDLPVSEIDDFMADQEKTTVTTTTTTPKKHRVGDWLKKEGEWVKLQGEKAKEERKINRERQANKIQKELETDEYLDEEDKERISDLDPRELTPEELKVLAIREGEGFWGTNKYEAEILRRIKTEAKIETDKAILINEEKARARNAIAEDNPNKPRSEGFLEWISKP